MSLHQIYAGRCTLGEGAFWHPKAQAFFWFDILGKRLFRWDGTSTAKWAFDAYVSAAGWCDGQSLLIASAKDLLRFDIATGTSQQVIALEADNPVTRSNDGRADPQGGFWIGTMGVNLEPGAGAIYRFYKGTLRKLFPDISIPNAICFAPDGQTAYFTDTAVGVIYTVALDAQGWPAAKPQAWLDLKAQGLNPDGAVIDAQGNFWNAQWGASRVAVYSPKGALLDTHAFPASQISCPCLGGPTLNTLFATSAAEGQPDEPKAGHVFAKDVSATGLPEPRILL